MMIGEHRIRVRVPDGRKLKYGKVKFQLGTDLHVHDTGDGREFVICATSQERIEHVRSALTAAGLEEVPGSTEVGAPAPSRSSTGPRRQRPPVLHPGPSANSAQQLRGRDLRKKPYAFVPLPEHFSTVEPVWHDGMSSAGRLSGEVRFEIENLTPLLVGWERRSIVDDEFLERAARRLHPDADGPRDQQTVEEARREYIKAERSRVVDLEIADQGRATIPGAGRAVASKSVLCPLRAPWGDRPVIIPGDSLKGLLRHELGAMLGAPMERVAERSYSYRPNSLYPNEPTPWLVPRLARVPEGGFVMRELPSDELVRVPTTLELLPGNLQYDRRHNRNPPRYRFDPADSGGAPYRGGLGVGVRLNSRRNLHSRLDANPNLTTLRVDVPSEVQAGYLNTLRHLTDLTHGHFSERHPDVPNTVTCEEARRRILKAARDVAFSPGDLVWVEWDTKKEQIVSFGWHYYYRWAYQDTVRRKGWTAEREGLYPLTEEKGKVPARLSSVRRLFGYTGDNEGSAAIGEGNHSQLMGRIFVNAAMEIVPRNSKDEERFLPPTFLKELGMPRPSAVEFYLEQPHYPNRRPFDGASLVTYGDAAGYDEPGRLSGRKFYLDRADAYTGKPWEDDSESNRLNDRSTLALEASRPRRRFRFTLRFRDVDAQELSAVLLTLCPHQFRGVVGGTHRDGYCSKLGYARPLGWGTVRIEAKELHLLKLDADGPSLEPETDIRAWFQQHFKPPTLLQTWLAVHRHKNPDADDYPLKDGQIYTFHTTLRAEHTRRRRYDGGKT